MDVVAATLDGDHPATYGWRTEEGDLAEPFLTTTTEEGFGQSLDHVYYWPKEGQSISKNNGISEWQHSYISSISEPKCNLEPCPYKGPNGPDGERPFHVSDHCGWSVTSELTWRSPPGLEKTHYVQPASLLPSDEIVIPPSAVQVKKSCEKKSNAKQVVLFNSKSSRLATAYWLLSWLVLFLGRQSLLTDDFGR